MMQEAKERVSVALTDDQAGGGKAAATTQMERAIARWSHGGTLQEQCRSHIESHGYAARMMQRAAGTESQGQCHILSYLMGGLGVLWHTLRRP